MIALRGFAKAVDGMNEWIGRSLSLFVWLTAIICALVVVLRYVFHLSFVWMQDLYVWTHALVFMVGASFAMLHDAHVRVDIFYTKWSPTARAWTELIGVIIFTLPWVIVTGWLAWPFIAASWAILEGSSQPNGMPAQYVFKSILLAFCVLVGLQACSLLARAILVLIGDREEAARSPFGSSPAS